MICFLCQHEHLTPLQCSQLHCNCVTEVLKINITNSEQSFTELLKIYGGIDPYAPKTNYAVVKEIPPCILCNIRHPSTNRYKCEKHGILCCTKVYPHYSGNSDDIDYYCCAICDNKADVCHFLHGELK